MGNQVPLVQDLVCLISLLVSVSTICEVQAVVCHHICSIISSPNKDQSMVIQVLVLSLRTKKVVVAQIISLRSPWAL